MDQWNSNGDIYDDFNLICDFNVDSDNSLEIELNRDRVLQIDESSNSSNDVPYGVAQENFSANRLGHSVKKLDQLMEEVTEGLKNAGMFYEEEECFKRAFNRSSSPASGDKRSFSQVTTQSSEDKRSFHRESDEDTSWSFHTAESSLSLDSSSTEKSLATRSKISKKSKSKKSKFRPLSNNTTGFIASNGETWRPSEPEKKLSSNDFPSLK